MAIEGRTTCAVYGCSLPISPPNNLCDEHRLPGVVVCIGDSTRVVTAWAVEHEDEAGVIFLNDLSLGNLFGGRAGFEKRLREQGFTGIRILCTPEELESAKHPANGKKLVSWGPWETMYPWQVSSEETKVHEQNLKIVKDPKDPTELLLQICNVIFDRMQLVDIKQKKDGTCESLHTKEGFMWIRITLAQLSELLSSNPAEADLAIGVAVFPDARAIVSARFDVRVRVSRSADGVSVSIAQDNRVPKHFIEELTQPYNAMHALHLVFDSRTDSDQRFVLAQFIAGGFRLSGWVDSEDAERWAAEGSIIGSGRPRQATDEAA